MGILLEHSYFQNEGYLGGCGVLSPQGLNFGNHLTSVQIPTLQSPSLAVWSKRVNPSTGQNNGDNKRIRLLDSAGIQRDNEWKVDVPHTLNPYLILNSIIFH